MFRVSRIRGDIRFATRRERDFRVPADFDADEYRGRPPWQVGDVAGEAPYRVAPNTAWWVERLYGDRGRLEGDIFVTAYASLPMLASWILRQDGRAVPLEPSGLRREVQSSLRLIRDRHAGAPVEPAREAPGETPEDPGERTAGPVAPERFAVLQSLLAHLLAACGDEPRAVIPASDITSKLGIPAGQLEEHLSLLNLVNFGGGCYTVYAELDGDEVRIDKELYGDTFRAAPRLTPLEARAIRLALEFVGPMIAADAQTPLDRVRRKLEETFGQFELSKTPGGTDRARGRGPRRDPPRGIRERRLVELAYLKEEETEPTTHLVEPYALERKLPRWYVHTFDHTRGAERSFRLDRMRDARLTDETFEPRPDFEPSGLSRARTARVWFSPDVARYQLEREGARRLADGAALAEMPVGSDEWLVGEIFSPPRRGGRARARRSAPARRGARRGAAARAAGGASAPPAATT